MRLVLTSLDRLAINGSCQGGLLTYALGWGEGVQSKPSNADLFQTLILNNVSINSRKALNVSSMSKTSLRSAIG